MLLQNKALATVASSTLILLACAAQTVRPSNVAEQQPEMTKPEARPQSDTAPSPTTPSPTTPPIAPLAADASPTGSCLVSKQMEAHPYIEFSRPISDQIDLYPGDKVKQVGGDEPEAIKLGSYWEPYERGRTYTVIGIDGQPVHPEFKSGDTGSGLRFLKLEVLFSCHTDKVRDKNNRPGQPAKKK